MAIRRPKSTKNVSWFSHEFITHNHADIVSVLAMVFIVGLMFQVTNGISSLFITLQHNVTVNATDSGEQLTMYTYGSKDLCTIFFYSLITIVVHAVLQEFLLDKLSKKVHLSKVKHSKLNESAQLVAFYAVSAVWGTDIIYKENYLGNINNLWEDYPHSHLPFLTKLYFLIQIAYWVHTFPELYFQKVKREEMAARVQYAVLYLFFIGSAYCLNLTRVTLCLLVFHYVVEMVFHSARVLYFSEKDEYSSKAFLLWNILFVLVRLGSITLAVLTFWYGLEKSSAAEIDISSGNFNVRIVRINCLFALCLLQAFMMWNFITLQQRRVREKAQGEAPGAATRKSYSASSPDSPKSKGRAAVRNRKAKDTGDVAVTANGSK